MADIGTGGHSQGQSMESGASGQGEPNGRVGRLELRDAFYAIGLVTLVIVILERAAAHLAPIALAVLVWFLINAIAQGLRSAPLLRHFLPEWLALLVAALLTIGAIYLGGRLVVENLRDLGEGFQGFDQKALNVVRSIEDMIGIRLETNAMALLQDLEVQKFLGENLGRVLSGFTAAASYLGLVILLVLFLLLDQPFYDSKIRALSANEGQYRHVRAVLAKIGHDTRLYIWIMTLVSFFVGVGTYFIAVYFGLKGAAFWGFLAFALNFIPTIGSFLGVIAPTLFAIIQFDDVGAIGAFALSLGVVQFVMGNLVLPRLTGDRLNLSQFVVIVSLAVWGAIWGVSGLFLAVPLMMVLAIVLAQFDSTRAVAVLMSKSGNVTKS